MNNAEKFIKTMLLDSDISQKDAAELLEQSSQSLNQRIRKGTITFNLVTKLADKLGYEIIYKKK